MCKQRLLWLLGHYVDESFVLEVIYEAKSIADACSLLKGFEFVLYLGHKWLWRIHRDLLENKSFLCESMCDRFYHNRR